MITLATPSMTITYSGMLVLPLHSNGALFLSANVIAAGVPARMMWTVVLVGVIFWKSLPLARTLPRPPFWLNVSKKNKSFCVGALTAIVHTTGLEPLHPGDPAVMFAITGAAPLTLMEIDFADWLEGTVTTTSTVTVE